MKNNIAIFFCFFLLNCLMAQSIVGKWESKMSGDFAASVKTTLYFNANNTGTNCTSISKNGMTECNYCDNIKWKRNGNTITCTVIRLQSVCLVNGKLETKDQPMKDYQPVNMIEILRFEGNDKAYMRVDGAVSLYIRE